MQHSKQRDSLSGTLLLVHRWRRPDGFGWRRILWRKLRNRSAVNRQELPQASIFLPETNISLLCRLEWKRFRTLLVPRSPLRATCQHFLEILLYARKHRGDISWEPAFFRQGLKRDLPNPPANRVFLCRRRLRLRRGSPHRSFPGSNPDPWLGESCG